jgi:hypothetical protein
MTKRRVGAHRRSAGLQLVGIDAVISCHPTLEQALAS